MSDFENVFLTETRRDVLNDEYTGTDSNKRTHQSNIRKRSSTALDELFEVAQSPHIDNRTALPPEKIGNLLEALYAPTIEPDGYDEYRRDLFYEMRQIINWELERRARSDTSE